MRLPWATSAVSITEVPDACGVIQWLAEESVLSNQQAPATLRVAFDERQISNIDGRHGCECLKERT